jgi:hypothetical protein
VCFVFSRRQQLFSVSCVIHSVAASISRFFFLVSLVIALDEFVCLNDLNCVYVMPLLIAHLEFDPPPKGLATCITNIEQF